MTVLSALRVARIPNLAFLLVGLFWGTFAAHVPDVKARLGVDDATFGLLLLGQALGLLTAMWIAPWFDRLLGPRAMQVSAVGFAVLWVLPGLVTEPVAFALVMAGLGIGSGLLDVVMNARVSELEAREGRTLMNASHGMFSVGYLLAALAAAMTRGAGLSPAIAFAMMASVAICLSFALVMPPVHPRPQDVTRVSGRFPWGPVLICGSIVLVAFMSEATVETWSALHVERTLGGSAVDGALGPAALGLTMAIGRFGGQVVSDRLRDQHVVIGASVLAAAGALTAALAPVPVVAYLGFGILGLGVSVIGPLALALVGRLVAPEHRTEAIAKAAVMGFSGFFIAPVLMGGLSELWGLRVAYAVVAGFTLLAIPLAVIAYSMNSSSKPLGT